MNNNYIQSKTTKNSSYMVFSVASKTYAININRVIEVVNMPELEMPVSTPEGIIGIFNYNGLMIKVVDICPFLGFQTEKFSVNNKLLVVVSEGNCFAIHTDDIDNIITPDEDKIQVIPFENGNSVVSHIYKNGDISVNIIDIEKISSLVHENSNKKSSVNYAALVPADEKSQSILKIRAEQNKHNNDIFAFSFNLNNINQYILFSLDDNNYFLDLKYVKEFISCQKLAFSKLPYTKKFVKGIVNIKGEFIVVLDLKYFLNGIENEFNDNKKIIVTESKNFKLALLVDGVKYIKNLNNAQINPSENTISKYITSEFETDGVIYNVLNFEKIINDENLYINIE